MARFKERRRAIELRRSGKSYSFIKDYLGVSKSTLSYWIKDIELTKAQLLKINREAKAKRIESYIKTARERRKKIFQQYIAQEQKHLLPLTKREFLIAGLFLYVGEGTKSGWWTTIITNTDPTIIKFAIFWLTKILNIPKVKIKVRLHLYSNMKIEEELKFWQKITGIPNTQFGKPYIKKTSSLKINHPTFGHGTCQIAVGNVRLKHKILAGIHVILKAANTGV